VEVTQWLSSKKQRCYGRRVKKGEHGIRILAPVIGFLRKPDTKADKDIRLQNQPVLVGFRSMYVFDVS